MKILSSCVESPIILGLVNFREISWLASLCEEVKSRLSSGMEIALTLKFQVELLLDLSFEGVIPKPFLLMIQTGGLG